jgi:MinD superfamily P-loop ATPase
MGSAGDIVFVDGHLRIGEAMAPPLIRAVKNRLDRKTPAIIDAPPGTSCPVIEAVKGSDFTLLVTEPTPFGLHDLKLAVEMVRILAIPFGVIINRSDIGDASVTEYCRGENIPVLMEIEDDRGVAEGYSQGIPMVRAAPGYADRFTTLWSRIEERGAS